jgi:hypothetical protein
MKKIVYVTLVMILILSVSSFSFSEVTLVPSISVTERYNDNIFLTASDEEDDFITIISPNIILNYTPSRYLDVSLDYGLNFRFYSRNSDLNDTSLRETQFADFRAQARPLDHFFIDVTDSYKRIPVDVRRKVATDNDSENMTDSNIFTVSPYVEVPLTSTLLSRLGYRYTNAWYKVDEGNDSESHSGYVSLTKRFPFRLNVSLNYEYVAFRPELTTDKYDENNANLAADYRIGPNLQVWGEIGKAFLEFEDSSDEDETLWDVGFEYRLGFWGSASVGAAYSASISEIGNILTYSDASDATDDAGIESDFVRDRNSVATGVTKTKQVDLYLKVDKDFRITVNPFYRDSEELKTSRVDKITGVSIDVGKPLTTKLSASLDGLWERQRFFPQDAKVYLYSLGTSFDYSLSRSITTELGYRYNKRDSRTNVDDYDNNIVWIEAKLTF